MLKFKLSLIGMLLATVASQSALAKNGDAPTAALIDNLRAVCNDLSNETGASNIVTTYKNQGGNIVNAKCTPSNRDVVVDGDACKWSSPSNCSVQTWANATFPATTIALTASPTTAYVTNSVVLTASSSIYGFWIDFYKDSGTTPIGSCQTDNDPSKSPTQFSPPYICTASWTPSAAGSSNITAQIRGTTMKSSSLSVTISDLPVTLTAPVMISPSNNASYTSPATISLSAQAGSNMTIDFYKGSTLAVSCNTGTSTTCSASVSSVYPGTYQFSAKARTTAATSASSGSISVTVRSSKGK